MDAQFGTSYTEKESRASDMQHTSIDDTKLKKKKKKAPSEWRAPFKQHPTPLSPPALFLHRCIHATSSRDTIPTSTAEARNGGYRGSYARHLFTFMSAFRCHRHTA